MAYMTARDAIRGRDLTGMNVIVTGGTSGLGAETVRVLAGAGASVVAASRRRGTAELPASVEFAALDLASPASIDAFARSWDRPLHLLVNNAGVMRTPLGRTGLTRRGVPANAVAPGAIQTDLMRHMPYEEQAARGWLDAAGNRLTRPGPEWKTIEQGAATTVWAAVAPELQGVGGKYLDNCAIAVPWTGDGEVPFGRYAPYALDPQRAERLWALSERLLAR